MNKFVTVSILILLLFSCMSEKSSIGVDAENIIVVNETGLNIKRKASDIFSRIDILTLETTENSLIGSIDKIVPVEDTFFLQDNKSNSIVLFNRSGNFLKRIWRQGRGPGEYIKLDDFTITRTGTIIILDGQSRKLIFLDKEGTYLTQQELPIYVDALECINDSLIVFNGSSIGDRVILWDIMNEKIIVSYIKYDRKYSSRIIKPLIKYGDNIYFQRANSSIIHNMTEKRLEEKWFINFGKRNINLEKMILIPQFGGFYVNPPSTTTIHEFIETDKYISLNFQCEEMDEYPYYIFNSKSTDKQIFLNYNHYIDDLIFHKAPPNAVTATDSGEFVAWTLPHSFRENLTSYDPKNLKGDELDRWNDIQRQMEKINDFDNPILLIFTLKDF